MEKKTMMIIAVVAVVVIAAAAIIIVMNNNKDEVVNQYSYDEAELKVLGNVNGDRTIDETDYKQLEKLVKDEATVEDFPLADVNNDKKIDNDDLEKLRLIIDKEPTTVWHINYYDQDGNGTMDLVLVDTKWPVSSMIVTGSSNTFMLLYLLDIIDEVKGASYGSTNDKLLFGSNYLDTSKVAKLGTSSTTITFEDGKAGSSNVIAEKNVTCLLSDWNRTYITNEKDFEGGNVDVVRVAAASFDKPVYTHSILLLGFLFQKEERANELVDLYDEAKDVISGEVGKLSDDQIVKAVATSMQGMISSGDSDYTAVAIDAGAKYGLEGYDFGGTTSLNVADNLGVYDTTKYRWDYIVHIRTSLSYEQDAAKINSEWITYTSSFAKWENAEDGQIFISGVMPIPARVAYTAYAMYGDKVDVFTKEWADNIHQQFIALFNGDNANLKAAEKTFVLTANPTTQIVYLAENYAALYDGEAHSITVTPITSGCIITYSTEKDGEYTATNPEYTDYGVYTVYFKITCDGRDTATGSKTVSINKEMTYVIEDYNGTVDGEKHGIKVTVTDPDSGATVKYYSSKGYVKTYGKEDQSAYMTDKAGTKTIWVYITAPGYQEVVDSGTVTLTAAA